MIASSDKGKLNSTAKWEQIDAHAVKIRYGGFYVAGLDARGQSMAIGGQSSKWEAKRLR